MAPRIQGPLYYERAGRTGPPMAFLHPNPMDQSCWMFQMAHFSTWFRCVSIDLPGYGRSPHAAAGLTMEDIAQAVWEAIDEFAAGETCIIVGCSVGAAVAPFMYHQHPGRTGAMILCGTGYTPARAFIAKRIAEYSERGIDYRWPYTLEDFSPAFRETPMAHFFADLFAERNDYADLASILHQFHALAAPLPEDHHFAIHCPTLILSGSEDAAHRSAYTLQKRIPKSILKVLPGAGHACQIEQPWLFDELLLQFLHDNGLMPPE